MLILKGKNRTYGEMGKSEQRQNLPANTRNPAVSCSASGYLKSTEVKRGFNRAGEMAELLKVKFTNKMTK